MLLRIAALATTLAITVSPPISRPLAPAPAGRPLILLLHGRGMLDRDTASLRRLWQHALEAGGRTYTRAPLLSDGDVRLVWYADVLDPLSSAGCDFSANDPRRA